MQPGKSSRHNQKWRGADESIAANLVQYGMRERYVDVLVADAAQSGVWRDGPLFDAIITDRKYNCPCNLRPLHFKIPCTCI